MPGHIAAALAGAGGAGDSAGQPWAGRDLSGDAAKIHNFEDDDGTADAGYLAAVAALLAGTGSEAGVVASLATARVFVPVVAQLAEEAEGVDGLHADKQADMALVTLKAPDGRTAMPVFTSAAALEAWHPQARPVAVYAARAALSAVSEGAQLLVLDPGSDVTFVVRRPAMWSLAQQRDWTPSYLDDELESALNSLAGMYPAVRRLEVRPDLEWRRARLTDRPWPAGTRARIARGAVPRRRPGRRRGAGSRLRTERALGAERIVRRAG
ncbi:hypothetical protein AHiyo8_13340 [Arthrobacter sp. Hiyo8]|nr:hypothetical protein AHiyo8_13340 [Arthrobacter sp. Hiyo8]